MPRITGKDQQEMRQRGGAPLYNAFAAFGLEALKPWDIYTREMVRLRSAQLSHCEH